MSLSGLFVRKVIAPLWAIKEGTPYLRHLKALEGSKQRPVEEVQAEQLQRLRRLLVHAAAHTDFYRERLSSVMERPETATWEQFAQIPLLTKDDIRSNKERMVARTVPPDRLIPVKTSGSTGVSLDLFIDEDSAQWKRAVTITYDRWAGWDLGERVGAIWGNPDNRANWRMYLRNVLLTRYEYLDTLKMDEREMLRYHRILRRKPPVILFGHAHSLFLFARFIQQKGLPAITPRGIISTCMVLHDFERATIEKVFGCRVTNRYGCEEVSLIACECPEGNMHLNGDTLIVEFIRDGKPAKPGEAGAIVVTDLTNYGMPFIRYKVGDVGIPSDGTTCACGCTYPVMESLEGRVADYVVTPDGNYISGISLTENFAMHLPGVKQMQIVQEKIDFLVFRIVRGALFSERTVADIDRLAAERFGSRMAYEIEYVDSIQSERSGKYRFCISKLPNPFS
ncbi:phenylacetate--CoA ligase family protein [Geobacter sp. FeAm09]|uniref:phenylacetate--CoA ligase family protein n=1 Tax=Geobacter sp. FeAm09 TaxID=2597769 RepID=UPI0011ED6B52|nr:phenylacetate--CoA ligase family protein [Geobacter sp. FeAm09]QEM68657.1 phenylacetate--CoA ligase family protein [Geobacter sp. FeAm09]